MPGSSRRRRALSVLALFAAIGLQGVVPTPSSGAPVAGSAGTNTALPATDSQVTVRGRGSFSSLEVTVNQTRKLVNQAVGVTWKGAVPTRRGPGTFAGNYLQIMQCWGDSDASVPENPGPPPEQCVQGAANAVYGGRLGSNLFPPGSLAFERIVSRREWPGFDPADGHLDERTGFLWKPFRAVDGNVTDVGYNPTFNPTFGGGDYWLNPKFNAFTTNEIVAAQTRSNGEGQDIFEILTGVELSGLGCGSKAEPVGGGLRIPKCWLVIVPRGSPAQEDVGTPSEANPDPAGVVTSPLSRNAWRNRIAIPLEFNPVDTFCSLSGDQSRLAGTELVSRAVASWQPTLCTVPGLPAYSYSPLSDSNARRQLLGGAFGAPGMVVVSRPFDPSAVDPANPVVYAPLTLSAVVIGLNVERLPRANPPSPPEVEALRSVRVAELNLTPRLVAKLLTQSYRSQVQILGTQPAYDWMVANPQHLGRDPDFLQFNSEFELLENGGKNFGGLVLSSTSGDVPQQVWEWVLADPEARAWLAGAADQWGMHVNPVYGTTAQANSTGVGFGDPLPDTFPKSDPYCYQGPPVGPPTRPVVPPLICSAEWLPLARSMRDAAREVRVADDGARTSENQEAITAEAAYKRDGSQPLGSRTILSITDSASAVQYGVQVARLSRAGDNGTGRRFIAPEPSALTAGFESMAPKAEPAVREPAPNASAPTAYPLTALTYAAVTPLALEQKARDDYAGFIEYAAGRGQEPGFEFGQLPGGFQPLPPALQAQSQAAAKSIRELRPSAEEPGGSSGSGGSTPNGPSISSATSPTGGGASSGASSSRSGGPTGGSSSSAETATGSPKPTSTVRLDVRPQATPILSLATTRFALPVLIVFAVLSALGALQMTKRPRFFRRGGESAEAPAGADADRHDATAAP